MSIDYQTALALKRELEQDYSKRHTASKQLRRYWHGDYWKLADTESHPIATIFRDFTARASDVGPDVKLIYNIVQVICLKYQALLSQLPQIRVYVDPPESDTRRAQATLKERFLYGCWSEANMNKHANNLGWYLPLMGDAWLAAYPDMKANLPTAFVRSPEYAYPIMSMDGMTEEAVIFAWKVRENSARREFPGFVPKDQVGNDTTGRKRLGSMSYAKPNPDTDENAKGNVEVLEYSDDDCYYLWVDGQQMRGVEHNLGFNLLEHVKFVDVPGEPFGHGAVEQLINLNEMHNALYSMTFQAMTDSVFGTLVLEDPQKAPEMIERGPGAIIPLNPGGKAYYLTPPVQTLPVQEAFLRQNEHNIKQGAGMSETEFGESPASSIVTGKAVDALQGLGSGSILEMVQGSSLGPAFSNWNAKALTIGQRMFRDTEMRLYGQTARGALDLTGRTFSLKVKGSQLVGGTRNEVVFQAAMNQHEKLVMGLQALGGGIVSKKYVREQIGIPDNSHMVEEILGEQVDDAVLGFMTQALQQAADPASAGNVEQQAESYLAGQIGPPHPLLNVPSVVPNAMPSQQAGAPPSAPPPALAAQPGSPPLPGLPGGNGLPAAPPASAGAPSPNPPVTVADITALLHSVQGLQGRVWIIGELAQTGQTTSEIELAVTDPDDRQLIADAAPQYKGRLVFRIVKGEPQEQAVEVTPGG